MLIKHFFLLVMLGIACIGGSRTEAMEDFPTDENVIAYLKTFPPQARQFNDVPESLRTLKIPSSYWELIDLRLTDEPLRLTDGCLNITGAHLACYQITQDFHVGVYIIHLNKVSEYPDALSTPAAVFSLTSMRSSRKRNKSHQTSHKKLKSSPLPFPHESQ